MDIGRGISDFYNERFRELGDDVGSVGWSSVASQFVRFELLRDNVNLFGKSILDLGCGLGDLVRYLEALTGGEYSYLGVDISSDLISAAKKKYERHNAEFFVGEIFDAPIPNQGVDWAFMSGVFSFSVENVEKYSLSVIRHVFDFCKVGCGVNFLSSRADFYLEKNHHFSPAQILDFALEICPKTKLIHGTPQHEFTLILRK